jgi:tRNA-Thr(GGU) m(6)t(6)A37 methyltransferase TsaA
MMKYMMSAIGIIHSTYATKDDAPTQGSFHPEANGEVELFPEYAAGLQDIELFSNIMLIYHFDRAGEVQLVRRPFLDDTPHGIFATRHPCRPNGIGITIVKLLRREGNILHVGGIDVLDGTPLLDIKPYVPRFDAFPDASEGWFAGKENREKPTGRE